MDTFKTSFTNSDNFLDIRKIASYPQKISSIWWQCYDNVVTVLRATLAMEGDLARPGVVLSVTSVWSIQPGQSAVGLVRAWRLESSHSKVLISQSLTVSHADQAGHHHRHTGRPGESSLGQTGQLIITHGSQLIITHSSHFTAQSLAHSTNNKVQSLAHSLKPIAHR